MHYISSYWSVGGRDNQQILDTCLHPQLVRGTEVQQEKIKKLRKKIQTVKINLGEVT